MAITLGTPVVYNSQSEGATVRTIDSTRSLLTDSKALSGRVPTMQVTTRSGLSISVGPEHVFDSFRSPANYHRDLVMMDSSTAVVFYQNLDGGANRELDARVVTISGTSLTFGPMFTLSSSADGGMQYASAVKITSNQIFLVSQKLGDSSAYGFVVTISGTNMTSGPRTQFASNGILFNAALLTPTSVFVAYSDQATLSGRGVIATISGTSVTFGSAFVFDTDDIRDPNAEPMSATKVIVAWRKNSPASAYARIATVSGTSITYGPATQFTASTVFMSAEICTGCTGSDFFVLYDDDINGYIKFGTVSGTDITFSAGEIFESGNIHMERSETSSFPYTVVVYRHESDTKKAKVMVIQLEDLATSTPAEDSAALFMTGFDAAENDIDLFVESTVVSQDDIPLFVQGLDADQGNTTLFIDGIGAATDTMKLFLGASLFISDGTDLFTAGRGTRTGASDLFVHGRTSLASGTDLFVAGSIAASADAPLTIPGKAPATGPSDLFIHGLDALTGDIGLFVENSVSAGGEADLFVPGHGSATGSAPLFAFHSEITELEDEIVLHIRGGPAVDDKTCPPRATKPVIRIPDKLVKRVRQVLESLIDQLGRSVTLEFAPDKSAIECPNCVVDHSRGSRSTGRYNGTGPIPFTRGKCPYCHGRGLIEQQPETRCIRALINPASVRDLRTYGISVSEPRNIWLVKGFLKDLDLVRRARTVILDADQTGIIEQRARLVRGPVLGGLRDSSTWVAFFEIVDGI